MEEKRAEKTATNGIWQKVSKVLPVFTDVWLWFLLK
jgi:hypothetical protein